MATYTYSISAEQEAAFNAITGGDITAFLDKHVKAVLDDQIAYYLQQNKKTVKDKISQLSDKDLGDIEAAIDAKIAAAKPVVEEG